MCEDYKIYRLKKKKSLSIIQKLCQCTKKNALHYYCFTIYIHLTSEFLTSKNKIRKF